MPPAPGLESLLGFSSSQLASQFSARDSTLVNKNTGFVYCRLSQHREAKMADIPFRERIFCTINEAAQATGSGRSKIYELINTESH